MSPRVWHSRKRVTMPSTVSALVLSPWSSRWVSSGNNNSDSKSIMLDWWSTSLSLWMCPTICPTEGNDITAQRCHPPCLVSSWCVWWWWGAQPPAGLADASWERTRHCVTLSAGGLMSCWHKPPPVRPICDVKTQRMRWETSYCASVWRKRYHIGILVERTPAHLIIKVQRPPD